MYIYIYIYMGRFPGGGSKVAFRRKRPKIDPWAPKVGRIGVLGGFSVKKDVPSGPGTHLDPFSQIFGQIFRKFGPQAGFPKCHQNATNFWGSGLEIVWASFGVGGTTLEVDPGEKLLQNVV